MKNFSYIILGIFFGIVMYKTEAASWFRIYEMFRFGSFHMYGLIGSALAVGMAGVHLIKKYGIKDWQGNPVVLIPKSRTVARYLLGGTLFGMGWALVGACPGPLFVLLGSGVSAVLFVIAGAVSGTYLYGIVKKHIPH